VKVVIWFEKTLNDYYYSLITPTDGPA